MTDTAVKYSRLLFHALRHLAPSVVDISQFTPLNFLVGSDGKAKIRGPTMRYRITCHADLMDLSGLLEMCDTLHTLHVDIQHANPDLSRLSHFLAGDRQHLGSLRHLRFENCELFPEYQVEKLVRSLLRAGVGDGLQSLEIVSSKTISEDFLLGLGEEVGDRLKWTS
ncbi:hypothetical protein BD410DRAFT_443672 [Rickenella mellea]|uniref:RNI-like protein n=1 Tax=Rickenella mellea TaxID=50990 RepID=A0A4Y7PW62_9AGAM|nr:hypothetical protein BD410DRAFT_443672 [Rickenella mellea]